MRSKLPVILALAAAASLGAHATVIDFESTGTPGSYNALNYAISGFVFNPTLDNIDVGSGSIWSGFGPAHSGSFAALNNHGGNGEVTAVGGGAFSFQSLWLKDFFGSGNRSITLNGWLNGAQVGTVGSTIGGSWTQVTGNFASIDKLVIQGGNYFLVDDIQLNAGTNTLVSPVPEATSSAAMLLGLGMLGALLRRRKNQQG